MNSMSNTMHTTKAYIYYCIQCHHESLILEDNNGLCIPCMYWDNNSIQHHHDMNRDRLTHVQQGKVCTYCNK